MASMFVPFELFDKIVSFLDGDIQALYCCTLVSREFYDVANPLLYKRIHVSLPEVGLVWQNVEHTLGRKAFATARLLSHCGYVQEFTLDGDLTDINISRQAPLHIIHRIPEAMRLWRNLTAVTLTPMRSTGDGLMNLVETLRECRSLRTITVNEFVMEEDIVPRLAELVGLEDLTLINPTRASFLTLPDWLMKNQDSLVGIKLIGDCGSLTPGILRKIVPCILNIRTLAIGLSYSLTNADVFACLSKLSELQTLRLRYYRQNGNLPPGPLLLSLRQLTVLHAALFSKEDALALSGWIRKVTNSSPLQSLETISTDPSGPKLCFDGLVSHIASKHHQELRSFNMPIAYVRGPATRFFLRKCRNLQHISLTVAFRTLQTFPTTITGLSDLRTVSLDVCDRPGLVLEKKDALKIMEHVPQLRCITVMDVTWEGNWVAQRDGEGNVKPEFVVGLTQKLTQDQILDEF